ncbi:MAG: hypothetical protein D6705_15770 [Deltaproteobacteria bacterium]|nr:MAG: hypothetical protein D6705_15770 [Deltaproteobacteria bacterium]
MGFALGAAALARIFVLPHLEAGAGLLDPNLGTAVAGSVARATGALLAVSTFAVLALSWPASGGRASATRVRLSAGVAAAGAGWLSMRGWPDLYAAYALVDRTLASPEIHARRAEHLHLVADLVLAGVVVALAVVLAGLLADPSVGKGAPADRREDAARDDSVATDSDAVREAA